MTTPPGWSVPAPEAAPQWRTCALCGAMSDDARDIRAHTWPVREAKPGDQWASGPRCVDHMACRIRRERAGNTWPVDDGTPPTRVLGGRDEAKPEPDAMAAAPDDDTPDFGA